MARSQQDISNLITLGLVAVGAYFIYHNWGALTGALTLSPSAKPVYPVTQIPPGTTVQPSTGSTPTSLAPGSVLQNTDGSVQVVNNDGSLTIPS